MAEVNLGESVESGAGVQTAASMLYDKIRRDVIRGALLPGQKLKISDLVAHYDAGMIPVREALSRLATSGFVEAKDQRGFVVRHVSAAELRDLTRVRLIIEPLALRESIEHGGSEWQEGLSAAWQRLNSLSAFDDASRDQLSTEWESAHDAFHKQLLAGCSSPWLLRFADELRDQTTRYRHISARALSTAVRDVAHEHQAIADAALARRAEVAVALLVEHVTLSMQIALSETPEHGGVTPHKKKKNSTSVAARQTTVCDVVPALGAVHQHPIAAAQRVTKSQ